MYTLKPIPLAYVCWKIFVEIYRFYPYVFSDGAIFAAGEGVEDIYKYSRTLLQPLSDFPKNFGALLQQGRKYFQLLSHYMYIW